MSDVILKVIVTYRDIDLAMTSDDVNKQHQQQQVRDCMDWLLLQSVGFKNAAVITCGHLLDTDRQMTSRGSRLLLHLHTAERKQRHRLLPLKGFRVSLTGSKAYAHPTTKRRTGLNAVLLKYLNLIDPRPTVELTPQLFSFPFFYCEQLRFYGGKAGVHVCIMKI